MSAGVAGAATPDTEVGSSQLRADRSVDRLPAPGGEAAGGEDTDGDALLDVWETDGYDADGDGTIDVDLPAMGADPLHKDVFVEMDYMGAEQSCPCHVPLVEDLERIVKAFKKSPRANNPDGRRGIRIHLDAGPLRGDAYDLGGGNLVPHDADLNPVQSEVNQIKAANFDPDRAKIFHYMIWAHGYGGGSSSGVSFGIPADTFIVTLGLWPGHGSSNAKVGTFIHELGHGLGLHHGGTDDRNYKPNYLSVMTYAFQIEGVPRSKPGAPGYFGYSRALLPTLIETSLVESAGLGDPKAKRYRTSWWCSAGLVTGSDRADHPLDWDCDGSIDGGSVTVDVNSDGTLTALIGARDWGNLVYDGGTIGAGTTVTGAAELNELTLEEYLRAP